MATNLATVNKETRLAIPAPEYSNEQIKLLAETVAKGCDQNELAFFLQVAKLKRLDPFTGQIHVVKRWDSSLGKEKISIQTGVDGYRAIASRTGDLAGIDDPEYDTETEEHPNWAKITVYRYGRGDEKVPYRATARWSEYVQVYKDKQTGELKPNPMWKKMPFLMLGKVAESLALRKAFPDELSGMYTNEEMGQADNEGTQPPPSKPPVSMPKSTDEKKDPPKSAPKAEPQQGKAETVKQNSPATQAEGEKISGEITKAEHGTGTASELLFLLIKDEKGTKLVSIPKALQNPDMVVGAKILLKAVRDAKGKTERYLTTDVELVQLPIQEGEVIDAEFTETPATETAEQHQANMQEVGNDLFGGKAPAEHPGQEAPPPAAGEVAKPGTIGVKRAKRLYAIIGQNHKNTNFDEAELKRIMSALPVPIEHLRDLEVGMYATFERWATGEEDFNLFWKD